MSDAADLAVAITECPVAAACLAGQRLTCSRIVASQNVADAELFQVPEPWSGHLERAPILFLSSNPSIGKGDPPTADAEEYPLRNWGAARRLDFFNGRFDARPEPWVDNHMRARLRSGPRSHGRGTRFWLSVRARATELMGRRAAPGIDYALSEVVHCKSTDETGVVDALDECVGRWMRPVLQQAGARVVVLLGKRAKIAFGTTFGFAAAPALQGPLEIEGTRRLLLQLPHPNARVRHAQCAPLGPDDLGRVRSFLQGTQTEGTAGSG